MLGRRRQYRIPQHELPPICNRLPESLPQDEMAQTITLTACMSKIQQERVKLAEKSPSTGQACRTPNRGDGQARDAGPFAKGGLHERNRCARLGGVG